MLTVVLAVFAGAVVGLAAPAVIDRIPAGQFPIPGELTRPHGAIDWAIVTAVAGAWGLLTGAIGAEPELPAHLYLGWAGVVLAVIDIRHHRLPDLLLLPSYPIALALLGVAEVVDGAAGVLVRALTGGVALAVLLCAIAFVSPSGLGLGDVKLAGLRGLYLGWVGWTAVVLVTVLAFISAAAIAGILIGLGRATYSSRIPFGPFVIVSALAGVATNL